MLNTIHDLSGTRGAVIGAGGHAKAVITILQDLGAQVVALLDDNSDLHGKTILGLPIIGSPELVRDLDIDWAICAIGGNRARARLFQQLVDYGIPIANAIHPSAIVAPSATLGRGIVIEQHGVVDADAQIGDNVIIGMHTMVAHDTVIGNHAHVAPGCRICGEARVGEGAFVAVNASVTPVRRVGAWATVGANAVVLQDIPDQVLVVGAPAHVVKPSEQKRVALIGAGGHALSVANFLGDLGHHIVGLLDDNAALHGTTVAGYKVLGPPEAVRQLPIDGAIVAIGDNAARKRCFDQLLLWGIPPVSVVHPQAYVARGVELGRGVVVMPLAAVNTGAVVGDNTIVSLHAVVSHESQVGSHCHIAANACLCGRVTVEEGAFVGAGATVIPLRRVGAWSTIGAGAAVVRDIPASVVAVGTPARVIQSR